MRLFLAALCALGTSTSFAVAPPAQPRPALCAGLASFCALTTEGAVSCWGDNWGGQLGDGTRQARLAPVTALGLTGMVELACGSRHTCALGADGAVWCWGHNGYGQSADPADVFVTRPRKVPGLSPMAHVFAGASSSCATDGAGVLTCWGATLAGPKEPNELGRPVPAVVAGLPPVQQVALSESHACALARSGEVFCWGNDDHHRAGGGNAKSLTPHRVAGVSKGAALAATQLATFVRTTDGHLVWWGERLGDGDFETAATARTERANVTGLLTNRVVAYVREGSEWKAPRSGSAPKVSLAGLAWAAELAVLDSAACGRSAEGQVRCWGVNTSAGLGDGTTTPRAAPVEVKLAAHQEPAAAAPVPPGITCADAPPPEKLPPAGGLCGNGKRDVLGVRSGTCAPCMPGHSCPCSPDVTDVEQCDGADMGVSTCKELGFGRGTLRCTNRCTLDASDCLPNTPGPPGVTYAWPAMPAGKEPTRDLAVAQRGEVLGALWVSESGCGRAVFARYSKALKLEGAARPLGPGGSKSVHLAATPKGWLAAVRASGAARVVLVSERGEPGPEVAAFAGAPAFLVAAGRDGPWLLGIDTRATDGSSNLEVAVLDAGGKVLARRELFGPGSTSSDLDSPGPADQAVAVAAGGGFLVARPQLHPGFDGGGLAVAKVSLTGERVSVTFVADRAWSPLWLEEKEGLRLAYLAYRAPPAASPTSVREALVVLESVAVTAAGTPQGGGQPVVTLEEGDAVVASVPGAARTVLLSRGDWKNGFVRTAFQTRVTLVEGALRTPLVDGIGLASPRMVQWGERLLVAWLFTTQGNNTRVGLASVLPAEAR